MLLMLQSASCIDAVDLVRQALKQTAVLLVSVPHHTAVLKLVISACYVPDVIAAWSHAASFH